MEILNTLILVLDPTSFLKVPLSPNRLLSWSSLFLLVVAAAAAALRSFLRKPLRISNPLPIVEEDDDSFASSSEDEVSSDEEEEGEKNEDEEKEDEIWSHEGLWFQESELRNSRSKKLPNLADLYTRRDVVKMWTETEKTSIGGRSEHDPIYMTADVASLKVWDARAKSNASAMTATWQSSGLRRRRGEDCVGMPCADLRMGRSSSEASWRDDAALVLTWTGSYLVQI